MFNNAESVYINGKEVQSIDLVGGGNLYTKPSKVVDYSTIYIICSETFTAVGTLKGFDNTGKDILTKRIGNLSAGENVYTQNNFNGNITSGYSLQDVVSLSMTGIKTGLVVTIDGNTITVTRA